MVPDVDPIMGKVKNLIVKEYKQSGKRDFRDIVDKLMSDLNEYDDESFLSSFSVRDEMKSLLVSVSVEQKHSIEEVAEEVLNRLWDWCEENDI